MAQVMEPRFIKGADFYDDEFHRLYDRIGYPKEWIEEGKRFAPRDSYVIAHPTWYWEDLPPLPDISLYELFRETVRKHPDETAVIFFDRAISYRDLDVLIGKYAALLKDLGIGKGDVVAAMLPNSLQHWVAFFGALKIGAVHTPINVMYQEDEVRYQVTDSGAKVLLVLNLLYSKIKNLHDEGILKEVIVTDIKDFAAENAVVPGAVKFLWDIPKAPVEGTLDLFGTLDKYEPFDEPVPCKPKEDTALLLYTAGTTGRSKGVIETHFNMVFNAINHLHAAHFFTERLINYSIMPMFHTAGYFLYTLPTLYSGGTVIPIPMFDLEEAFRVIQTYGVTVLFAPPTLFIALMSNQELLKKHDLSSLILTIGCGAPVPVAVQDQWRDLTEINLTNGWGMTETNSGGCISIPGKKEKMDSIGIPVYSEMKVVDEKGAVVPRNEPGEIYYRGLQVARGYWNKPEETKETFGSDGWLHTGDRGFIDEEDFIHFVDREKDLIVASGYNLAPVEVENTLYQNPHVAEAAVIGIPHEYRGETVKAFVVLKGESKGKVSEQELIDFCKQRLATFKVPRVIEFRDALPKSAVGKILRRILKDEEAAK
ncbi:MAG: AMP-binding protein [Deltaproteobacteria bacterium]|nr:AMP-binding protein [Deltaproteobacteria bacterium]